jgi:hypothetical protein
MKAALVNQQGLVENIIVWDETCNPPDGYSAVVIDNTSSVGIGHTHSNGVFIAPPEPEDVRTYQEKRASSYPSYADQFDILYHGGYDAWKAAIDAVKAKYPKPE